MIQPPYAWPSCEPEDENKAAAIAQILSASFNQSGTKIKHADEAILSAARHIVRSNRIAVFALAGSDQTRDYAKKDFPPLLYAIPMLRTADENKAAVIAQILSASFNQSGTKIKHADEAILSAARHIVRSERITVTLKV